MNYRITDEVPYSDPHSRGTGSIVTQRKGYVLRTRGDHNHMVRHDYRCPVHGVFEAMVPSGDVPSEMPCPEIDHTYCWRDNDGAIVISCDTYPAPPVRCDGPSTYQAPMVGQGWAAGTVKS